jgi:hypothetical protein
MLQFTALRAAAAGVPILPFFDYQRGLVDLVTQRSRYVSDWVRVFYNTVYVDADRVAIRFMFMGQQQRLTREGIAELLQVDLHDDSIHYLAYPNVEPPRRAHSPVLPIDEEISFLFQKPCLPGTPRTPDRLIREAYVVHYSLRRSVLYRMGNAESLTGVQQWLLMYMMAKRPFDLMDGMGMMRQQPFAHWISWLLSRLEAQRYIKMLESSKFVFPTYRPLMPGDRRRVPRGPRRHYRLGQQQRQLWTRQPDGMLLSLQQRHLFLSTSPQTTSPLVTMRISHLLQSQFSESVGHTTTRQEAPPCQARERLSHRFPRSQLLR